MARYGPVQGSVRFGVWFGPGLGSGFDSIRGSIRFGAELGWDCVKFGVLFAEPSPDGVHVGFCFRYRVRFGLRFDSERDTAGYRFRYRV